MGLFLQFAVLVVVCGVAVCHDVEPPKIDAQFVKLPSPPRFVGKLRKNRALVNVEHLLEGQTKSQQSFVKHRGIIYTGTANGTILRIENDVATVLTRAGACSDSESGQHCGYPIGLRMHPNGVDMLVADSFLGLLSVNIDTGVVTTLIPVGTMVNGEKTKFFEDVEVDKEGIVYIAEGSTKWGMEHTAYLVMEAGNNGRVLRYNPKNGKIKVLMKRIAYCTGLQLSNDQTYLLVSELVKARILRLDIRGPRKGQSSIFADNLPGMPDNIRPSMSGGYWVALVLIRQPDMSLIDYGAKRPWLREFLVKVLTPQGADRMLLSGGMIVELRQNGSIRRSLQDLKAESVMAITEVMDDNGMIYLGSYFTDFIARKQL